MEARGVERVNTHRTDLGGLAEQAQTKPVPQREHEVVIGNIGRLTQQGPKMTEIYTDG